MGYTTKIAWTNHTFNIVFGCVEVSQACRRCYAREFAKRLGYGKNKPAIWGKDADRRVMPDEYWQQPLSWNGMAKKAGQRRRVFCSSMADVFEDHPITNRERLKLWPLIRATPWLDWMLLTKRHANVLNMMPDDISELLNVWPGMTIENRPMFYERAPLFLEVAKALPRHVTWVSAEPVFEAIPWRMITGQTHQIIFGGESGPGCEPFEIEMLKANISNVQAGHPSTKVFVKQLGGRPIRNGRRIYLKDDKGGNWDEWPDDVPRLREIPLPAMALTA